MKGLPDKPNLTPDEIGAFLKVSAKAVKNWAKEGKYFDPYKVIKLPGGGMRFPHEEVVKAITLMQAAEFKDVELEEGPAPHKRGRHVRSRGVR